MDMMGSLSLSGGGGMEKPGPSPEAAITLENLVADNRSRQAIYNRQRSQAAFEAGEIDVTAACSDARVIVPNLIHSVKLGSIATGGARGHFLELFNDGRIRSIINLAHFSSQTLSPGKRPTGCGGLIEKEKIEQNGSGGNADGDDIAGFIENDVFHSDVIVQTSLAARSIAKLSEKPVMAAAEDHLTGQIYILAVYQRKNGVLMSLFNENIDPLSISREHYDEESIYKNGLPSFSPESLPDDFRVFYDYIKVQEEKMERMKVWYPNLEETQKVQNRVKAVLWTTDPRPAELRYPLLFQEPGSLFLVSQARIKDVISGHYPEQDVRVPTIPLREGLKQVQYPLSEAVAHADDPQKAFSKTNTLIIETGNLDLSIRLRDEVLKKAWMRRWMEIPHNQIITVATYGGVIKDIEEFRL